MPLEQRESSLVSARRNRLCSLSKSGRTLDALYMRTVRPEYPLRGDRVGHFNVRHACICQCHPECDAAFMQRKPFVNGLMRRTKTVSRATPSRGVINTLLANAVVPTRITIATRHIITAPVLAVGD